MRKLITLILIVLLAGCAKVESGPGASFEDVDIDAIYESFQRSFSYVHYNFYYSTPHQDLDPDYEHCDENYACKARNYDSLEQFRRHMIEDYDLTENFADSLLSRYTNYLYDKEDGLYVVDADRGSRISVGNRIAEKLIRESDDRIIHRATYESIDLQTGKVNGSFDVDSILVLINGEWLWDDIPVVY